MKTKTDEQYLTCEHKTIYGLLMMSAGMMGAYTFNLRGGVFCNAQTANFLIMSIAVGKGHFEDGVYFLIPITAYCLGAFFSELLPSPVKKLGFLRWDTYLVGFETMVLFGIGFIPLTLPNQIVQVAINFIASMQYNTFRQAEGIPMATTFCTNHLRQIGNNFAKFIHKKDVAFLKRILVHFSMILCFLFGATLLSFSCKYLEERSIWLALIPMLICFGRLVHADLTVEHDRLSNTPRGH